MRKLLFLLLAPALLLSACVQGTTVSGPAAPDNSPAQTAQKPKQASDVISGESAEARTQPDDLPAPVGRMEEPEDPTLRLTINAAPVEVQWEVNEAVSALQELTAGAPLTIQMSPYGGFEQVGPIGQSLPRSDAQTTTAPGDLVLYSGDQIVVFYGSNTWAYTRLGKITNLDDSALTELLSGDAVTLTISFETDD